MKELNTIYGLMRYPLIFYGLYESNDFIRKTWTWFIRLFTIVSRLYYTGNIIYALYNIDKIHKYYKMAILIKSISAFILYAIFWLRVQKMSQFLGKIREKLKPERLDRIGRCGKRLFIIWILLFLITPTIEISNHVIHTLTHGVSKNFDNYSLVYFMALELMYAIINFEWIVTTILLYTYVSYTLYEMEKQFWDTLSDVQLIRAVHLARFRVEYMAIDGHREFVNTWFGVMPFVWLSEAFTSTCFRITQLTYNEKQLQYTNSNEIVFYFFEYTVYTISLVIFLFTITEVYVPHSRVRAVVAGLSERCDHSPDVSVELVLFQQTINYGNPGANGLSAWSLYRLDRRLIFSFTGAVIPFTVMFIQLSQS